MPTYLALCRHNKLYPLSYVKEEKPILHQTSKSTTLKTSRSTKRPKLVHGFRGLHINRHEIPHLLSSTPCLYKGRARKVQGVSSTGKLDEVMIHSMPNFKIDKLCFCTQRSTSFIAKAKPEPTEAQIAHRIRRRVLYRHNSLEKQRSLFAPL